MKRFASVHATNWGKAHLQAKTFENGHVTFEGKNYDGIKIRMVVPPQQFMLRINTDHSTYSILETCKDVVVFYDGERVTD